MSNLQTCIILAGGLGTRLRTAVPDRPKCLAPVGNTSFLEIQLALLSAQGITDFIISVGHLAEMVIDEVDTLRKKFRIQTVIESSPLGTGGAILWAMQTTGLVESIVTNGDTFLDGDISNMLLPLDLNKNEYARMAVTEVANRERYGGVTIENNLINGFTEKGIMGSGFINAGMYRLHSSALSSACAGDTFSFEQTILPKLISRSHLGSALITGNFTDIGVPEDYFQFVKNTIRC